jgi:MurNAc alpha-1-phosphate uridylyltransferase
MKAMILAAGKGTRLLPLTDTRPKALLEVQGVSLLEHTIRYLKYFGVDEIVINVHHYASQITAFLEKNCHFGIRIEISDEQDELLDTGGGLYKARGFFDDGKPFILSTSDVITNLNLQEMYRFHQERDPLVTLAVKHRESSREFLFDDDYRLCGWKNNLSGETRMTGKIRESKKIAFSAIHVISPRIFDKITERGSFSIVDVYLRLAADHTLLGFEHDRSMWYEFGRIENLERLNTLPEIRSMYKQFH